MQCHTVLFCENLNSFSEMENSKGNKSRKKSDGKSQWHMQVRKDMASGETRVENYRTTAPEEKSQVWDGERMLCR